MELEIVLISGRKIIVGLHGSNMYKAEQDVKSVLQSDFCGFGDNPKIMVNRSQIESISIFNTGSSLK